MALAIDVVGSANFTSSGTAGSCSITLGGSATGLEVIMETGGALPTSITVLCGATPMTLIGSADNGSNMFAGKWGLLNPPTGLRSITASYTGASENYMVAISYTGIDTSGSVANAFPNFTSGTTVSTVNVTSAAGHIVTAAEVTTAGLGTLTGTSIFTSTTGALINGQANWDVGAATVTIGSNSSMAVIVASDVKPAAGGGATRPRTLALMGVG